MDTMTQTVKPEKVQREPEVEKVGDDLGLDKDLMAGNADSDVMELLAKYRSVTGVLSSGFGNMDLKFSSFSLSMNEIGRAHV